MTAIVKRYRICGDEQGRAIMIALSTFFSRESRLRSGFNVDTTVGGTMHDHVIERVRYVEYVAQSETVGEAAGKEISIYALLHDAGTEKAYLFSVIIDPARLDPDLLESILSVLDQLELVAHYSSFRSRPLGPVYFRDYLDGPIDTSDFITAIAHPSSPRLAEAA